MRPGLRFMGDAVHDPKAVFALDFYLSGIISAVARWHRDKSALDVDELDGLFFEIAVKGMSEVLGPDYACALELSDRP